ADALAEAQAYATRVSGHPRFAGLFWTVADELISNALYDAPVDAAGARRFHHLSRNLDVDLEPGEEIEVRLSSDGRRLGISVSDPFGSLLPATLQDYLGKGF